MKGAKAPGKTLRHVFVLVLILALVAINSSVVLADIQGGSQGEKTLLANPSNLESILKDYESNTIIKLEKGNYTLKGTVKLTKPVSLIGEVLNETIINIEGNGENDGFLIGKGETGTYKFSNLTIKTKNNQSDISIRAYKKENFASVKISNCVLVNESKTAIDFEGTTYPGPDSNYFDLTVSDCNISAGNYGIGSGLNNNNPDVSNSSLTVRNSRFNSSGGASIYCIHTPNPLKNLLIENNTFAGARSGGIKYIFAKENEENVIICNNDFSKINNGMLSSSYGIMCTNLISELTDKYSYCWATQLSGNNLINQSVLILAKAKLEAIWFPDGQATNSVQFNNLSNSNETNQGTRYGVSRYGKAICLTDFNILQDQISFRSKTSKSQQLIYSFNGPTSGLYTNYTDLEEYWTDLNPRHCSSSLATFKEADDITRWLVDNEGIAKIVKDEKGHIVKDINGQIMIEPVNYGTTYITGVTAGGADNALPNPKSDRVKIVVKAPVTYHSNYPNNISQKDYVGGSFEVGTAYQVLSNEKVEMTVPNYDFVGWTTTKGGKVEYKSGSGYKIPADETDFYGVWEKEKVVPVSDIKDTDKKTPSTGDNNSLGFWLAVITLAGSTLLVSIKYRKQ